MPACHPVMETNETNTFDAALAILIAKRLAARDLGDGAWGWTAHGKSTLPPETRMILSNAMYGERVFPWEEKIVTEYFGLGMTQTKERIS